MSHKLLLYLVQSAIVLSIAAFHIQAARLGLRRIAPERAAVRRWAFWGSVALITAIDLPLLHSFIFYKVYHPLWIDQLMHDWSAPFLALHANAALFGMLLLGREYLLRPVAKRFTRRRAMRRRSDGESEPRSLVPGTNTLMVAATDVTAFPSRRRFIRNGGLVILGAATSARTLSAMWSTHDHTIERVVIKIPGLPEGLKGTTIAMISDVHSSVFMTREEMDRYVKLLNGLNADIAVVTGDFVNSKVHEVYPLAESFSALHAPLGVYGVTGNHDYYTGDIATVSKEIEQSGIKLIRNGNLSIEKNGEKLWLLGMDDSDIYDVKPYLESGKSPSGTIENLLSGIPDGATKIFLCHKPYPFEEYSQLGIDLMLSGHTHGGQVVIAHLDNINLSFASLASSYVAGLYKSRSARLSQLYVSRGVGTVGIPLRLNCPPELTHIVLV